jgi:hypothetical protein
MPRVRFESTIPEIDRAKTNHALDRADTVIGITHIVEKNIIKMTTTMYVG